MNKPRCVVLAAGFMVAPVLFCGEPQKNIDFTQQLESSQMLAFVAELGAYKNIVKAAKEAQESAAYRKSLKTLIQSFNNCVQTFSRECAKKLNPEEKEILKGILADVKNIATILKNEMPRVNDANIDQVARDLRDEELKAKVGECYQQLMSKIMPFSLVLQGQRTEEVEKEVTEFFNRAISFFNTVMEPLNK
jgi:thiamine kinase-like enzyme